MRNHYTWKTLIGEIILALLGLCYILPLYFVFTTAVKSDKEVFSTAMGFPADFHWENFKTVWEKGVAKGLVNSLIITLVSVVILVILGAMVSYVIARRTNWLTKTVYWLALVGIMIPFQLSIVFIYFVFAKMGLTGNHIGMIILWSGVWMPMTIILYTGFMRTLPKDYEEAARIDGASPWKIFWKVVFPLQRPITGTVAVVIGLYTWNDFFASNIFLGGSKVMTLPVAIYQFVGQYVSKWNLIFTAVLVAIVPVIILFIFTQKQMIKGFAGGMKG